MFRVQIPCKDGQGYSTQYYTRSGDIPLIQSISDMELRLFLKVPKGAIYDEYVEGSWQPISIQLQERLNQGAQVVQMQSGD